MGDLKIEFQLPENFLRQPAVQAVALAIQGTPFENCVWLVGGVVRDALLGRASKDLDMAVLGDAQTLARLLYDTGVSSIFPVIFERFGTAQVMIEGTPVELVSTRTEKYVPRSRKPNVRPGTILQDARRRDFTVNALYLSIADGELLDPTESGLADLRAAVLRTPLDPDQTFRDDPLRMLRAVRFRARLEFAYAPDLEASIHRNAPHLANISQERIQQEFMAMLGSAVPSRALLDLERLGLLAHFIPELNAMRGVEQGSYHHLDVLDHSLLVLDNIASDNLSLRLAGLLHDVGKPSTRFVDEEGRTRFFGHEHVGAEMAGRIMNRLKFSHDETSLVTLLISHHMRFGHSKLSSAATRRVIRDLGPFLPLLLDLCEADSNAHHPDAPKLDFKAIRAKIAEIEETTPFHKIKSPLDGRQILDVAPTLSGPQVGQAKQHLLDLVLNGDLGPDDLEAAGRHLQAWLSENRGQ